MRNVHCMNCGFVLPGGKASPCPRSGKMGRNVSIGIAAGRNDKELEAPDVKAGASFIGGIFAESQESLTRPWVA